MKKLIYTLITTLLVASHLLAQEHRFLTEIYDQVAVETGIVYGENATILFLPDSGQAIKEKLLLDVYQPVGDAEPLRPLVIFFHSGNFIPFPLNQNIVGTRKDSSVVTICKKLAKTGYVVASADYRLGWNPLATESVDLNFGLINAAYRGVQDANTCIRFFKKTFAEDGNPFRIDTSRIVLWGDDSGGYISLNAGCLDKYEKIYNSGKFWYLGLFPMIIEYLNGDPEAKHFGVNDPPVPGLPYPPGDTLNYVNYPQYSSKFRATVNQGGAVGDTMWMDPGQPPIISIHAPYDLTTPCGEGIVYVFSPPDTYIPIVEVQGSCLATYLANVYGNNDCLEPPWNVTPLQFAVTDVANSRNNNVKGLFPIYGDKETDGTPWEFWDCDSIPATNCNTGLYYNPNMSKTKAEGFIDSILAYTLPRLYRCMDLELLSTQEIIKSIDISTYPNPTVSEVEIQTPEQYVMRNVTVYDIKGALVNQFSHINSNDYRLPVHTLLPGLYVLKIQFDQGIASRQIVVK